VSARARSRSRRTAIKSRWTATSRSSCCRSRASSVSVCLRAAQPPEATAMPRRVASRARTLYRRAQGEVICRAILVAGGEAIILDGSVGWGRARRPALALGSLGNVGDLLDDLVDEPVVA